MKQPVSTAVIAATNTAAAAVSFISLIAGCFSVEIKSIAFSIAVFINSAHHTNPIVRHSIPASVPDTFSKKASITTKIVATVCTQRLCSVVTAILNPLIAGKMLFTLSITEKFSLLFICKDLAFFICFFCTARFTDPDKIIIPD